MDKTIVGLLLASVLLVVLGVVLILLGHRDIGMFLAFVAAFYGIFAVRRRFANRRLDALAAPDRSAEI